MKYRSEIDGLRAVAVLPVILFHAGFDAFEGGFVGVDVFFVISGYLITSILIADIERGDFSLLRFYERRARRILPALFFVMACCLPFAWAWMYPDQLTAFARSLVAVSLFVSNILFWQESGYFSAIAEEKPLLHTWSLAVEEQYYLLFPIFLVLVWRFGRNGAFWSILVLALGSLALAEWGARNEPTANFYLTPTRAWELFAGSLAAFVVRRHGPRGNEPLAALGLAAILFALLFYDSSTPFPGLYALVPVLGTVLVILFADAGTLTARFLSLRAMVGIGLISYSAYLWHQPLFAFARIRSAEEPAPLLMIALAAVSLVLAAFSWKYVEQPFRGRSATFRIGRPTVFALSAIGMIAFTAIGTWGALKDFDYRLTDTERQILTWETYPRQGYYREGTCFLEPSRDYTQFDPACDAGGEVVVWGDSYAAALSSGWILADPAVSQFTASVCPPIVGARIRDRPHCPGINDHVVEVIGANGYDTVVLHGDWVRAATNTDLGRVADTISGLRRVGVSDIVLLGGVPRYYPNMPRRLLRAGASLDAPLRIQADLDEVLETDAVLRDIAQTAGVPFVSFVDAVCDGGRCDAVIAASDGTFQPMVWDNGHVTHEGAMHVLKALAASDPATFGRLLD